MLKAYLSTQPFPLSSFMVSKTHIVAQKPWGKQLNAKVFFITTQLCFNNDNSKIIQVLTVNLARN